LKSLILLSILLISCSSSKKRASRETRSSSLPEWVSSPMEGCDRKKELCASGEGYNLLQADVNARKSLASIFESKISSEFSAETTSFQEFQDELGEMMESTQNYVNESVDVVLEGVAVKKRIERDGLFFALVSLDRRDAADKFRHDMKVLDDQLQSYYSQKKRSLYKKMLNLFQKREEIYSKFKIVSDQKYTSPVSMKAIYDLKYNNKYRSQKIKIYYNAAFPESLKDSLKTFVTDIGHKVVTNKSAFYDQFIEAKFVEKQEYINVSGFQKYSFVVSLRNLGKGKSTIGSLEITEVGIGRSKVDAFLKVRNKIRTYIEENLDLLKID